MRKTRDYRQEYQRRIDRGLSKGLSRSAARGHIRAEDIARPAPAVIDRADPYERAVKSMKRGISLKMAAQSYGLSPERLRRHLKLHTTAQYQGRRWTIFDSRPQPMWLASRGKLQAVTVADDDGGVIGHYWSAVSEFLRTNNADHLADYAGEGVRDVSGRFHPFEVGPNTLRKMDSVGELNFTEIYADVAA